MPPVVVPSGAGVVITTSSVVNTVVITAEISAEEVDVDAEVPPVSYTLTALLGPPHFTLEKGQGLSF